MKFMKWSTVFIICFALSAILLKSFSQAAFFVPVKPWIFGYAIKEYPVFYYLLFAFLSGLGIGLFTAVYNYFTMKPQVIKLSLRVKHLEKEVALLNGDIDERDSSINEMENSLDEKKSEIKSIKKELGKKNREMKKVQDSLAKLLKSDNTSGEVDLGDLS